LAVEDIARCLGFCAAPIFFHLFSVFKRTVPLVATVLASPGLPTLRVRVASTAAAGGITPPPVFFHFPRCRVLDSPRHGKSKTGRVPFFGAFFVFFICSSPSAPVSELAPVFDTQRCPLAQHATPAHLQERRVGHPPFSSPAALRSVPPPLGNRAFRPSLSMESSAWARSFCCMPKGP